MRNYTVLPCKIRVIDSLFLHLVLGKFKTRFPYCCDHCALQMGPHIIFLNNAAELMMPMSRLELGEIVLITQTNL